MEGGLRKAGGTKRNNSTSQRGSQEEPEGLRDEPTESLIPRRTDCFSRCQHGWKVASAILVWFCFVFFKGFWEDNEEQQTRKLRLLHRANWLGFYRPGFTEIRKQPTSVKVAFGEGSPTWQILKLFETCGKQLGDELILALIAINRIIYK